MRIGFIGLAVVLVWAWASMGGVRPPEPDQGKLRVLSIGINQYPRIGGGSIQYGVADAEAVAEAFKKAGSTAAFTGVEVTTLFDEQATLEAVTFALHALAGRSSPADTLMLYFGGQGRELAQRNGAAALPEYLFAFADTRWKGIDTTNESIERALSSIELSQLLRQIPARQQIVILDSEDSRAAVDALNAAMHSEKRFSLNSAGRRFALLGLDGPSPEFEELGHGVLTYALLKGMAGEADGDRDGTITEAELEGYLTWKIPSMVAHMEVLRRSGEIELASYSTLRKFPLSITKPPAATPAAATDAKKGDEPSRGFGRQPEAEKAETGGPGKDYALVLAGDVYDHWKKLDNPIYDATTLERELAQNYGYEVRRRYNPTVGEIADELDALGKRQFGPRDRVLVYIAGHGDVSPIGNLGFLVGKDSLLPANDPHHSTYYALSVLKEQLANTVSAGHLLLVLDTCYSGTFDHKIAASKPRGEPGTISKQQLIDRFLEGTSRQYLTSGGVRQVSDGEPGQHSPFARRFLGILRGYGGERGVVSMDEIKEKMSVLNTRPYAGYFYADEDSGNFVFIANNDAKRVADPSLK